MIQKIDTFIQILEYTLSDLLLEKPSLKNLSQAKTQQRDDRRGEYQEAAYDYQQRRAAGDKDRQIVSYLISILNTHMRDPNEYIALRIAAGEKYLE